jgi:aspartyl/asparaginyl beta-hydroxylase (cupin superfamily)
MKASNTSYEEAARAGLVALQNGDATTARATFEAVIAAGKGSARLSLLLAQANLMLGDDAAQASALDQVLSTEPENLYAILMKGDLLTSQGNDRAAVAWYNMALNFASNGTPLSTDLTQRLKWAQQASDAASRKFEAHLEAQLSSAGYDKNNAPLRLAEALEIQAGRKEIFLQQPTSFYYPGLPQIQFYEPHAFPWIPALEAAAPAIMEEALAMINRAGSLEPYVQKRENRPVGEHALLNNPDWSACYFWQDGQLVLENARHCPATVKALTLAPIPVIRMRSPMALFSVLRPQTHIPAHHGMLNTRLIVHLPLIVPDGCALRVGNDVRTVEAGKALIFDDSIEHEAWNNSDETRVVLLFEVWRPELTEDERRALTVMYEAISDYRGLPES